MTAVYFIENIYRTFTVGSCPNNGNFVFCQNFSLYIYLKFRNKRNTACHKNIDPMACRKNTDPCFHVIHSMCFRLCKLMTEVMLDPLPKLFSGVT